MSELVIYDCQDRIAYLTLNRPEKRNALNAEMVVALSNAFERAERDEEAKLIVLRAEGKAFCAGADLDAMRASQANAYEDNLADSRQLKALFLQIYTHSKVVIAQVQGHAIAGGCGLTTVCDFVFAAEEALFGYTEVRIGFVPAIVAGFLVRKIGEGRARQLLLSGHLVTGAEARSLGLINEVIPAEDLVARVDDFARQLNEQNSGQSMALTKEILATVQGMSLTSGLEYAAEANAMARNTDDCRQGVAAFLNKEKLVW